MCHQLNPPVDTGVIANQEAWAFKEKLKFNVDHFMHFNTNHIYPYKYSKRNRLLQTFPLLKRVIRKFLFKIFLNSPLRDSV